LKVWFYLLDPQNNTIYTIIVAQPTLMAAGNGTTFGETGMGGLLAPFRGGDFLPHEQFFLLGIFFSFTG
jgi:hypothetical protein